MSQKTANDLRRTVVSRPPRDRAAFEGLATAPGPSVASDRSVRSALGYYPKAPWDCHRTADQLGVVDWEVKGEASAVPWSVRVVASLSRASSGLLFLRSVGPHPPACSAAGRGSNCTVRQSIGRKTKRNNSTWFWRIFRVWGMRESTCTEI